MNKIAVDVKEFIKTENSFHVMAELKRNGVLTEEDIKKAMSMKRDQWLNFMFEKVGITNS